MWPFKKPKPTLQQVHDEAKKREEFDAACPLCQRGSKVLH